MENLPIDTKSLPSRIFYSEEEDKVYVGEPGDYKEVGGGGSGLPPSEEGKFLVGGASDWEKREISVYDLIDSPPASGVRLLAASFTTGVKTGYVVTSNPSASNAVVQWAPGGVLKGNDAVANNDLVPLGQLNTILENLELPADQVSYDNTASGLLAETVQEAVDEIAGDYVNAGTNNTTGSGFSLDKLVLRNQTTGRITTFAKPNTDPADSNITIPGFGGGTKVMPISVNGVSAGPSGDITLTLEIDKFIGVTLGGSSSSVNIGFAASNPNITGYEEIEIGIQFFNKPTSVTDFYLTFNNNTDPIYNSHLFNSVTADPHEFQDDDGFRFKFNSDYGMYTFRVKNYAQTGIPRIITGTGVEVYNESSIPVPWVIGGAWHEDINVTSFQIKTVDGTTNVPNMRVTVKRIF